MMGTADTAAFQCGEMLLQDVGAAGVQLVVFKCTSLLILYMVSIFNKQLPSVINLPACVRFL